MFEKRIKEISGKLNNPSKKEFCILTHKKHNREIYFQNNSRTIKFIEIKFNPSLKKFKTIKNIIYFLIRARILQPFLKKIKLSPELGGVIFVAGQIKSFDLEKNIVTSFPKNKDKKFIKFKGFQKNISEKGFAPKIFEINKKFPFSKEELLLEYKGGKDAEVFKKLCSFYDLKGIKEITLKKYIYLLNRKLRKSKIKDSFIKETLKRILLTYSHDTKLKTVNVHGDFAKEQILLKNNSYVFVDWSSERDIIARDLIKFFRVEKDLLNNNQFNKLLNLYPKDVKKNIGLYIILNEIYSMIKRKTVEEFPKKRIENVLNHLNLGK